MNRQIKEIISELGIFGEEEHYEIAETVIRQCANIAGKSSSDAEKKILNFYGLE